MVSKKFQGPLSGLMQFQTIESPLMLKDLFVLEIFTFLPWYLGYIEQRLDKKANFKIYDVTELDILRHTRKTNFITFQTVLLIQRYAQSWFSVKYPGLDHHVLCMIFQEYLEYFSCYTLLSDKFWLSAYLYLLRYWTICVF